MLIREKALAKINLYLHITGRNLLKRFRRFQDQLDLFTGQILQIKQIMSSGISLFCLTAVVTYHFLRLFLYIEVTYAKSQTGN